MNIHANENMFTSHEWHQFRKGFLSSPAKLATIKS